MCEADNARLQRVYVIDSMLFMLNIACIWRGSNVNITSVLIFVEEKMFKAFKRVDTVLKRQYNKQCNREQIASNL